jgi:hypothetical protein
LRGRVIEAGQDTIVMGIGWFYEIV